MSSGAVVLWIAACVLGFLLGTIVGAAVKAGEFKNEAVKRGAARWVSGPGGHPVFAFNAPTAVADNGPKVKIEWPSYPNVPAKESSDMACKQLVSVQCDLCHYPPVECASEGAALVTGWLKLQHESFYEDRSSFETWLCPACVKQVAAQLAAAAAKVRAETKPA